MSLLVAGVAPELKVTSLQEVVTRLMVVKCNSFCRNALLDKFSNILVVENPISLWIFCLLDVGKRQMLTVTWHLFGRTGLWPRL